MCFGRRPQWNSLPDPKDVNYAEHVAQSFAGIVLDAINLWDPGVIRKNAGFVNFIVALTALRKLLKDMGKA